MFFLSPSRILENLWENMPFKFWTRNCWTSVRNFTNNKEPEPFPAFRSKLKAKQFDNRTTFHHQNTRLVQYSDLYFIEERMFDFLLMHAAFKTRIFIRSLNNTKIKIYFHLFTVVVAFKTGFSSGCCCVRITKSVANRLFSGSSGWELEWSRQL